LDLHGGENNKLIVNQSFLKIGISVAKNLICQIKGFILISGDKLNLNLGKGNIPD